jgi:uncharacterized protein (TIGR03382 family)
MNRLIETLRTACLVLVVASSAAKASTLTFVLDQDGCTGTCGTAAPFATVTITDFGAGDSAYVTVTETLNSNERYAGTGAGKALEFQLDFAGYTTVTNLTSGFTAGSGGASASTFGQFSEYISCSSCHGGQSGNPAGPLSFDLSSSTGPITSDLFSANTSGYYFASDIVGNNGKTGNVASNIAGTNIGVHPPDVTATPEPVTAMLAFSGLALALVLARRTNHSF